MMMMMNKATINLYLNWRRQLLSFKVAEVLVSWELGIPSSISI
jgi:hypothetical protein